VSPALRRPRFTRVRRLGGNRWIAAVVVLLLAVLVGFEVSALLDSDDAPAASTASGDLARDFALAITSFDHKRLDADVARVLALGDSGFEREFRSAMGPDFTQRIASNQTVSIGHIVAGPRAQRSADGRTTFVVVVDQQITSEGEAQNEQAAPNVDQLVLLITVDDDANKVSNVQEVART
jgi:Mce-associated membrane protein